LEFSRKSEKEVELVDVNRLLEMSLSLLEKDLLVRDIHLVKEMSNIPNVLVNMDEMKQVLLNLILNATQSMPKGGELKVKTSRAGKEKIRIKIKDTGVGIRKDDLSEIFNPFFTTKAPGEGTGLGLSLVHSVIKSYEGTIQVESKEEKGTSFIIELPVFQEKGRGGK
jgi:signal transduction histidine kinase